MVTRRRIPLEMVALMTLALGCGNTVATGSSTIAGAIASATSGASSGPVSSTLTVGSSGSTLGSTASTASSFTGQATGQSSASQGPSGATGLGTLGGTSTTVSASTAGATAVASSTGATGAATSTTGTTGGTYNFSCGNNPPCPLSQVCCVSIGATAKLSCVDSCPDAADVIDCNGPADCNSNAPYCCGTEVLAGGSGSNCKVSSFGASCQSSCPNQFANGCTGENEVVLCQSPADCQGSSNNKCCTFSENGATITFCASSTVALLGGGQCM